MKIHEGTSVLDRSVLKTLTSQEVVVNGQLTKREQEIFELVSNGLTNKEIAASLYLSEGTVRNVLSIVMDKMGVKNRTQLSLLATGQGPERYN